MSTFRVSSFMYKTENKKERKTTAFTNKLQTMCSAGREEHLLLFDLLPSGGKKNVSQRPVVVTT